MILIVNKDYPEVRLIDGELFSRRKWWQLRNKFRLYEFIQVFWKAVDRNP